MIEIYIDGSCIPNPRGIATYGVVIYRDSELVAKLQGYVGKGNRMSCNLAEYAALLRAFSYLKANNMLESSTNIMVYSDSQLLVNQMNGIWSAKGGSYIDHYRAAIGIVTYLRQRHNIEFKWIRRESNKEADSLSKEAYKIITKIQSTSARII